MGRFSNLCEDLRNAIDDEGAKGCFKKSVGRFSHVSGIPREGLWAAVDGVLQGFDAAKMIRKLSKSWGGTPQQWELWIKIAKTKPDCPSGDNR